MNLIQKIPENFQKYVKIQQRVETLVLVIFQTIFFKFGKCAKLFFSGTDFQSLNFYLNEFSYTLEDAFCLAGAL